ncbi:MAG: hypothetical protein Q8K58_01985 [Acidimicrobiales bacterium]|nr:hypothetical protein [Acidimicrobiales bacterium]
MDRSWLVLAQAADERRLSRIVTHYGRLDLLCLDELGYVQLGARGMVDDRLLLQRLFRATSVRRAW